MAAFMGMRGNGDWATNQMPENWRETILHEFPNGDTPITGIMSMMASEATDSPVFHWWTKRLASQAGAVTSIYIDAGLGTEYVKATHSATHGQADDTVYAKMAEALAKEFRVGHKVTLRDESMFDVDVGGEVTGVNYNGASSYVAIKLLEADDNSATTATYNLATVDRIIISGSTHSEGSAMPRAVAYDPVEFYNYTGIYRTALEMTRTAKKTHLRTGDQVEEAKREALELHGIEREKDIIWGIRKSGTGANGKPKRSPWGILPFVKGNATNTAITGDSSFQDYRYTTNYSGQSWLDGGEDWLDDMLEYLGTYCKQDMVAVCGAGAITGLTKLAKYTGQIVMQPGPNDAYGMKFSTWVNPHVTLHIKKHPLLAREASTKYMMIIYDPKNIKDRILDDTMYLPDRGPRGLDGEMSEYLTEAGPEFYFADQWQILDGVGKDSSV